MKYKISIIKLTELLCIRKVLKSLKHKIPRYSFSSSLEVPWAMGNKRASSGLKNEGHKLKNNSITT